MNHSFTITPPALGLLLTTFALNSFAIAISTNNPPPPPAASTNQLQPPITATQSLATAAAPAQPAEAEPTEADMRQALQKHIDDLNASMQPTTAPPTTTTPPGAYPPAGYTPPIGPRYNNLYKPVTKDSQYENWTDVAHRAGAAPRLEIISFKKIHCTPAPGQPWFLGDYIAEIRLTGDHPIAQEILQTSGKLSHATFIHGDTGWIWGQLN